MILMRFIDQNCKEVIKRTNDCISKEFSISKTFIIYLLVFTRINHGSWASGSLSRSSSWRVCRRPGQIRTFISVCSQELHPFGICKIPTGKICGITQFWSHEGFRKATFTSTCTVIQINNTPEESLAYSKTLGP